MKDDRNIMNEDQIYNTLSILYLLSLLISFLLEHSSMYFHSVFDVQSIKI